MNKPKRQGTAFETFMVDLLASLGFKVERLAEGGSKDEADLRMIVNGVEVYVECRARERMNVPRALYKARGKTGQRPTVLAWKRLVKKPDLKRRVPDGERITLCLTPADLAAIVGGLTDDSQ